jgi:WD40 repeat protein
VLLSPPDGQILASGSDDNTIVLYWVVDGTFLEALHDHTNWVNSVAFSSDGQSLASGSNDKTMRLWRLNYYQNGINK